MSRSRSTLALSRKKSRNVSRPSQSFVDQLRAAGRRASMTANQPYDGSSMRHIQATLAQEQSFMDVELSFGIRFLRWVVGLLLLPICFITTYTLISQFSSETLHRRLWLTQEFWYFTTGSLLMSAWFFTGLMRTMFLYLYVLGHELTHAIFVFCHLGKVSDMKVSVHGGYIATNKSNLLISLSPYFFPFWSMVLLLLYGILSYCFKLPVYSDQVLYAMLGATWTFHLLWTLWMIPRDQPDLRENDTFFSLVIIYLANILILATMLCLSSRALTFEHFTAAWWIHAEQMFRVVAEFVNHTAQS